MLLDSDVFLVMATSLVFTLSCLAIPSLAFSLIDTILDLLDPLISKSKSSLNLAIDLLIAIGIGQRFAAFIGT